MGMRFKAAHKESGMNKAEQEELMITFAKRHEEKKEQVETGSSSDRFVWGLCRAYVDKRASPPLCSSQRIGGSFGTMPYVHIFVLHPRGHLAHQKKNCCILPFK